MLRKNKERIDTDIALADVIQYPLVVVEWEDAVMEDDPAVKTLLARTAGWLLEKNRKHVKLASEAFEDGSFRQVTAIPKKMVKKVTYLTGKEKE